jgi:RND family efflux transporter MFP subunit
MTAKQNCENSMKWLLLLPVLASATVFAEDPQDFDCLLEPHQVVNVNTAVRGKIKSINVERSDVVEQGQVLAELESEVEKAEVALARKRAKMKAELMSSEVSYAYAKRKLRRFDGLLEQDVVSAQTKDEVETEEDLALQQIAQARENRQLAELELERAIVVLKQRTVTSPISGVVVERFSSPGEFADDEALMQLAQLDPLNVEVIMPAYLFGSIQPGMQGQVTPESPLDSQAYPAVVKIVDRLIDASSGTFGVRLELPNPDYKLPGGLKCMVRFDEQTLAASK